jgi:hypothetical protein
MVILEKAIPKIGATSAVSFALAFDSQSIHHPPKQSDLVFQSFQSKLNKMIYCN